MYCISQAYKMQYLDELQCLLSSLLVVALSEEIGHRDNESVPAEKCLQVVNKGVLLKVYTSEEFNVKYEV